MSIYKCPECDYRFDEKQGDEVEGYPAGTRFLSLPDDFACPDCSVCLKDDFELVED